MSYEIAKCGNPGKQEVGILTAEKQELRGTHQEQSEETSNRRASHQIHPCFLALEQLQARLSTWASPHSILGVSLVPGWLQGDPRPTARYVFTPEPLTWVVMARGTPRSV